MKAWQHFNTITKHKLIVMRYCFEVGLFYQGLTHDLSKYSPCEFLVGCRYYQGDQSPNNAERIAKGYSAAWLHHKGRNKHHYEYWIDYSLDKNKILAGAKMPTRYVVEMFMDRIAASKTYQGGAYTDLSPLRYFESGKARELLHPETAELLEKLLRMFAKRGKEYTFYYIRRYLMPLARREEIKTFFGRLTDRS